MMRLKELRTAGVTYRFCGTSAAPNAYVLTTRKPYRAFQVNASGGHINDNWGVGKRFLEVPLSEALNAILAAGYTHPACGDARHPIIAEFSAQARTTVAV